MIPYDKLARVYDRMEMDSFSVHMAEYTLKTLRRFGVEVKDALDLCCGTGTAVKIFSDRGWVMSGLDRSRDMLKVARAKLRGRNIPLYCQELPRFEIREKKHKGPAVLRHYDLITCFYDSLNYLKNERELKAAFRSVHRHLKPGGWFMFDMNTPHMLRTIWGARPPFAGAKDDVAWIFQGEFVREITTVNLYVTLFVKSGKSWKRLDEVHTERGYSGKVIKLLLKNVGFDIKGYYKCLTFDKPDSTTNRICAVVQRPAK